MATISILQLPAEVLVAIMGYSADLPSLQNFVSTCRLIYSVYDENRSDVLGRTLYNLVGFQHGCAVDAEYCAVAEFRDFSEFGDNDALFRDFINEYKTKRAQRIATNQSFQNPRRTIFVTGIHAHEFETREIDSVVLDERWPRRSLDHLCRLSRRHMYLDRCVRMFLNRTLMLSRLRDLQTDEATHVRITDPPSAVESQRIYRAFYRLEMFRLLFEAKKNVHDVPSYSELAFRYWSWLSTFPGHELDEIGTVYQWLCDEWIDIVSHMSGIPSSKWGTWSFVTQQWFLKRNFTVRGVRILLKFLDGDSNTQFEMVNELCAEPVLYEDIGTFLFSTSSIRHHYQATPLDDGLPNSGDELEYQGDHVDAPNFAWIWSKNGRMETLFCDHQDADLRRLGYVMWDHERLRCWPIYSMPRSMSRPRSEIRER